jgi:FO synthase
MVRSDADAAGAHAMTTTIDHVIRRALHRAQDGKVLSADEAEALLHARGDDLERLMAAARRVRDAGHGTTITFSKKVFIPLTRLCRDLCHYCTFATTPEHVQPFLLPEQAIAVARAGQEQGCKEALFTLGDRPEMRYPQARQWLAERGYSNTLDYVRAMAIRVIEETGLLPHLNPGVMSWDELARLKPVSASMGLMLESSSSRLYETPGEAHYGSPDKKPLTRLRCIEDAGRHAIPFTTGILIGIGETHAERVDSLLQIRKLHAQYGHVQEVIIQNFRAKPGTVMEHHAEPTLDDYLATIAVARLLLGPKATVQAPPNLSDRNFPRLLDAGINDFGGVSPVTPDHVNPERPWPHLDELERQTKERGYELKERLAIYPHYAQRPDPWLSGRMRAPVLALCDDAGFARAGHVPEGIAWQDPDVVPTDGLSRGIRSVENAFVSTQELARSLRDDTDEVHGSWDALEVVASKQWAARTPASASDIRAAVAKAGSGAHPTRDEAVALFQATGDDLDALCRVADDMRADAVGDVVTYVVNRNINFTNVCYVGCRFCAFAQRRVDADAYTLSLDEIARRAEEAWNYGADEVCLQGGIHPDLPGDYYFDLVRAIKARVPAMHVHAFSAMEIMNGATRLGISYEEWLTEARNAGLDTIPGTAAEILDDDVRWVLTKGKLPADLWEQIHRTAHALGIRSTSTIMYGHVDAPPHWVDHIERLRRIQSDTGGFTEFVPLPFVHQNAPIYLAGKARPGPTWDDNRRMHAIARILLRGSIDNVQVSWVKLGIAGAQAMLQGGANDFGGTLMEETISRMAGASHGIRLEPEQIQRAIREIGRVPARRSTTYERIELIA